MKTNLVNKLRNFKSTIRPVKRHWRYKKRQNHISQTTQACTTMISIASQTETHPCLIHLEKEEKRINGFHFHNMHPSLTRLEKAEKIIHGFHLLYQISKDSSVTNNEFYKLFESLSLTVRTTIRDAAFPNTPLAETCKSLEDYVSHVAQRAKKHNISFTNSFDLLSAYKHIFPNLSKEESPIYTAKCLLEIFNLEISPHFLPINDLLTVLSPSAIDCLFEKISEFELSLITMI